MKRKDFLYRILLGSGAMLIPVSLLNSCKYTPKRRMSLTENDIPLLDEIGETIIPTTMKSPGAKAAKIGDYMFTMINDCFNQKNQDIFLKGLNTLDERCAINYERSFIDMNTQQKLELLEQMQIEAIQFSLEQKNNEVPSKHYFDIFKNLTLSGYFTSKIGATQARKYQPVPGKYKGCIPYKNHDRPWAEFNYPL